jgi:hypothetical protein
MLTFLPWKTVTKEHRLGQFRIFPYYLGTNKAYDAVLSNFHTVSDIPIESASIIEIESLGPDVDIGGNLLIQVFEFGEILALSFLSKRKFFSDNDYSNYHSLRIVIQSYKDGIPGIFVNTRRRDGSAGSHLTDRSAVTKALPYIYISDDLTLDEDLCKSLLKYSMLPDRPMLDTIFHYLQANTDSHDITYHSELVLMSGAIEGLLGVKNGNTSEITKNFCSLLGSVLKLDSSIDSNLRKSQKKQSIDSNIRSRWIKDFVVSRGDIAHGRKQPEYKSIWSIEEHMVISAEIYPLLVKAKLRELGLYAFKDSDYERIFYFDNRIAYPSIMGNKASDGSIYYGWDRAVEHASYEWHRLRNDLVIK